MHAFYVITCNCACVVAKDCLVLCPVQLDCIHCVASCYISFASCVARVDRDDHNHKCNAKAAEEEKRFVLPDQ